MSPTAQRAVLLGSCIRLEQENFLNDLLDAGLFCAEIPLGVAAGHSEPSGQEQHGVLKIIPVRR
jgi:hypothetical protein